MGIMKKEIKSFYELDRCVDKIIRSCFAQVYGNIVCFDEGKTKIAIYVEFVKNKNNA